MLNNVHKQVLCIFATLCAVIFMSPILVEAAYYNTYSVVDELENGESCNRTQGFAVGSTYLYSAKCNDDESKQIIYQTNLNTGVTSLMKNGDTSGFYTTYLGHANDMDTCTIDGKYHLFVATMKSGDGSLVNLQYSGNTYYQTGSFCLKCNGVAIKISGVKKYAKDDKYVYFLFFRKGDDDSNNDTMLYKGKIPLNSSGGDIAVSPAFNIKIAGAKVNGKEVDGLTSFSRQGIGYIAKTDQLLVPLTQNNVSIILVYNDVSTATGEVEPDSQLSFRITSSKYPTLFEIEGCDETNGKLYFNCNRKSNKSDIAHDAVCYFQGFQP